MGLNNLFSLILKGGSRSGNIGHSSIPGHLGGSAPGSKGNYKFGTNKKENLAIAQQIIKDEGYTSTTETASGRKIENNAIAIRNNTTGEIYLNPSAKFWKDPKTYAEQYYKSGFLSTDNPAGVLYHEIAHSKYNAPDNFYGDFMGARETAGKVSKYARVNPKEFVSETYAGLRTGKKYDEEIMAMFGGYAKER